MINRPSTIPKDLTVISIIFKLFSIILTNLFFVFIIFSISGLEGHNFILDNLF